MLSRRRGRPRARARPDLKSNTRAALDRERSAARHPGRGQLLGTGDPAHRDRRDRQAHRHRPGRHRLQRRPTRRTGWSAPTGSSRTRPDHLTPDLSGQAGSYPAAGAREHVNYQLDVPITFRQRLGAERRGRDQ
ncbi:hypothetical protein HBB16_11085 [Pseudonocardia sp. MCCB 268]|nr:hypothetical protein [Pseudonocardia cytotoxica]